MQLLGARSKQLKGSFREKEDYAKTRTEHPKEAALDSITRGVKVELRNKSCDTVLMATVAWVLGPFFHNQLCNAFQTLFGYYF